MSTTTTFTSTTSTRPMLAVATEAVTGTALLEAAFGGKVQFFKVRETGTHRRWTVLAPKSTDRKKAEAIRAEVEKGTVADVAAKHSVSVATLRRTLTALAFTEELEAMTAKERTALAKSVNVVAKAPKEQAKATTKPEPKPEPKKDEPKAKTAPVKFPNAATMRARLVEAGGVKDNVDALSIKDLKVQFAAL